MLGSECCRHSTEPLPPNGLDTTSHDFVWKVDTFGSSGSSTLYDVTILDSLIYSVGEIYLQDSSGKPDPLPYNFVCGSSDALLSKRVTVAYNGNVIAPVLEGVFAFSPTDLWVVGSLPIHGNGVAWTVHDVRALTSSNLSLSKVWGTSSSNLFCVGLGGSIAHYDGSTWRKVEGSTTTAINDVYGMSVGTTGAEIIYCAVSDFFQPKDRKILTISVNLSVDSIAWTPGKDVVSVWSVKDGPIYACGDGLYQNDGAGWKQIDFGANIYCNRMRGSSSNNVFVVGDFGLIAHYNGNSWAVFYPIRDAILTSVAVTSDLVVAVGTLNGNGVVITGHRVR